MQSLTLVICGSVIDLRLPEAAKFGWIHRFPIALFELIGCDVSVLQGADKLEAGHTRTFVGEQTSRRDKQPDPA